MPSQAGKTLDILKKYWGYDAFRPLQQDIIESVLAGHDTLGLMPTGGGKSITFQVPTMAMDGMALVVTPIISLMKDQVDRLRSLNIKATYLYAGLTRAEVNRTYEKCLYGNCKFLYVSPERLQSQSFLDHLRQMPIKLIVVDEAHCISQWGYDFRPSFLRIVAVRKLFPKAPVLALTATATPVVVDDIQRCLDFKAPNVFSMSFARGNLSYVVRPTEEKITELLHILRSVPGTAIVYVRSRRRTKQICDELNRAGIHADFYHAGLYVEDKEDKQNKWTNDECRVMVATNAFGMGIDKPDVRLVVHVDVPNSLEEYYQEAGRAGRDGKRSYAVLLVKHTDQRTLRRHISEAFPDKDFIRKVYERVGNFLGVSLGEGFQQMFDFNFNLFCRTFDLPVLPTHNALKILTQAGYIEFVEEIETQSRVMIFAKKEDLYDLDTVTPGADQVLQAILRLYTGLFADYVFINEDVISFRTGLDQETIYRSLLELSRMHVLHYVPRKRTPYIIYTTSREEPKHILFPKSVYEQQLQRMTERIEAIINYSNSSDGCRERMLLGYFGEKLDNDCGHCDLCIDRRKREDHVPSDVQDAILYMAEIRPRRIEEFLHTLSFPRDEVVVMLSFLVDEGFVEHLDDDTYRTVKR
ncbi:MAG: RecQ family ATP-dependent DNA helicase [Muribaculaceae bacterium]|nr:RecQ family ATP-dependent DNA helicase [Muribaculaceae bacterium]